MKSRFDRVRPRYTHDSKPERVKIRANLTNTNEGDWICHSSTRTWFEVVEIVDDLAVGLSIKDRVVTFPVKECHHPVTRCK